MLMLLVAASLLVHDVSGQVIVPSAKLRIISTAPALTEILYAIGAGTNLVAASDYCNYPKAARLLPRIGSPRALNVEKIVSLRPLLIVAAAGTKDQWRALGQLTKAQVFMAEEGGVAAVLTNIRALGQVTGQFPEATELARQVDRKIQEISAKTRNQSRPRTFYMVWNDPLMTAGSGSFLDELIGLAGGENIGKNWHGVYPRLSWESLLWRPPEVLLGPRNLRAAVEATARRLGVNYFATIDEDIISRPGPRIITALDLLHRAIHPATPSTVNAR
ncbi:MAG: ABC transporter substrate-binding protein [Cyanobacteria bacterium NC_groundwater_1444_Ag_S-0.65um_54_12]|nr:ABC transporter substrate-binding protein [Cyanobacteria bacterium NC_groundwater_1444_Ag_S-0.65um_54_12]